MLAIGDPAPSIGLKGLDGKNHNLDERFSLALFFKTTCPTCQYAFPFYDRLYQAFHDKGIQVLAVSQHDAERTRQYRDEFGGEFPILIDDQLKVSRQFDPDFVPTAFLIREGRIADILVPWDRDRFNALGTQIAEQLGVAGPKMIGPEEQVQAFKAG